MSHSAAKSQPAEPIGVVLPTLNAMAFLPEHLATMSEWLDLVQEVVVVDSESTDGTAEFLQRELPRDKLRFFSRPRGLYQAWNFGIAQVSAPFTYISTVGDAITRRGVIRLHEVARATGADVVVSPPDFVDESGQPIEHIDWPVHQLIRLLAIREPLKLDRWVAFGFGVASIAQAILGSSASNIYRSDCLQRAPFPVDFGTAGDCAWGLAHGLDFDIAILPETVSHFREHEKAYAPGAYEVEDLFRRMDALAESTYARVIASDLPGMDHEKAGIVGNLLQARADAGYNQRRLSEYRNAAGAPWYFRPVAWRSRLRRDRARREAERWTLRLLAQLATEEGILSGLQGGTPPKWLRKRLRTS